MGAVHRLENGLHCAANSASGTDFQRKQLWTEERRVRKASSEAGPKQERKETFGPKKVSFEQ